jgi:hypothetical protein
VTVWWSPFDEEAKPLFYPQRQYFPACLLLLLLFCLGMERLVFRWSIAWRRLTALDARMMSPGHLLIKTERNALKV